MKSSFFDGIVIVGGPSNLLQMIKYGKRFRSGFPRQIHPLTTILPVIPITMGPPHGSLKGLSTMTGRREALSYGPTGIVRVFL